MKNAWKVAIVVGLAAAVAGTFALRAEKRAGDAARSARPAAGAPASAVPGAPPAAQGQPAAQAAPAPPAAAAGKPRLLELGSNRCMACLEMAKVLDALRASQGEKLQVDFIDVFEDPAAADAYKITLIPAQILYDGAGRELFRHTGHFSHDDILAKFRELGVKL